MSKNTTKRSLLASVFALVLCVAMLVGSTFAWFTDTATSGVNKIQSGKLDVKLSYLTDNNEWKEVTKDTKLFKDGALWEPGHTEVAYLKVQNAGAFLPHAGADVLEGTLGVFANRMAKLLFNLTVEHNITNHLLAADVDMTREEYNKMRGGSVREVTSTRGTISLKDVIQEDYYD